MTISRPSSLLIRCAALAVLAAALVWFNLPGSPSGEQGGTSAAQEGGAPVGHEIGELLPDFTLATLDGGSFTLSAQRGRVAVINLWATWCAPCVNELPHFDRLQREYGENVAVLAIHSDLVTDDVAAYLSAFDYSPAFAIDESGAVIASVGGSTMLPQTVVLDRDGRVAYNRVGSLTYEALEEIVLAAMG